MKKGLWELMKCPYCGTDLEVEEVYEENSGEIINGLVKCECSEYPLLQGILNLKVNSLSKYSLELLKKGKTKEALMLLLGANVEGIWTLSDFLRSKHLYGQFFRKILLTSVATWAKHDSKKYFKEDLSFCDLLGDNPNQAYFKHRFSSETLWSVYPFVPLLKENRKRILDLGCGGGHASFIISTYVKPEELICADHTFKSLYLAKKYFVKDAQFICLDANYPLPFKDDIFSSVFMLDAFHYVDARASLAKEFERVLSKEGPFLLLHLHNALVENVAAGKPLSPSTWKGLFDHNLTALPEKSVVEDFVLRDRLDLSKKYSEEELNLSNAISIIGEDFNLDCFDGIWKDILNIKENLVINPLYKMKEEGDKILLERNFPSEFFRKEYPLTEKYLPERCEIDKKFVKGRSVCIPDSDEKEIDDLMRKFVVINVPEKYMKV
ncbi:MAG TPA: hypothetical protein C5S37_10005 [Methanophagales archaeon]|nr:hypothetical protein [Methanophagales archaeon]